MGVGVVASGGMKSCHVMKMWMEIIVPYKGKNQMKTLILILIIKERIKICRQTPKICPTGKQANFVLEEALKFIP